MEEFPYPSLKFVLNRRLAIESEQSAFLIVYDTNTNVRRKIGRRLYELLISFREPHTLAEVIGQEILDPMRARIEELLDAGFLLDTCRQRLPRPKSDTRMATTFPTLFHTPFRSSEDQFSDIAIVGVPYDSGNVVNPGTRNAPQLIRKKSCDQEYRVDFATGKPTGWFEVETMQRLLEGVTIADWGDVPFTYGESPDQIFARVNAVCREIIKRGAFPAFIGGDHSISYPVIEALQDSQKIQVIWFDAHTDYGELLPGHCHNHKNVVTRLFSLENVIRVINVGHRGYTVSDKVHNRPEKFEMVTAAQVKNEQEFPLLRLLLTELPCYVSMDIDVLDPIYALGTSTAVPGGLAPQEVKHLLRVIGTHVRIIGCDVVEVNPFLDPSPMTLTQAYHLLTVCLSAATQLGIQNEQRLAESAV